MGSAVAPSGSALAQPPPPFQQGLAVGLTEFSPYLIGSTPGSAVMRPWQRRLDYMRPKVIRLAVNWSEVQPKRDRAPNWTVRNSGCARGLKPCAPYSGVRDQLRAIRARVRFEGSVHVLVVFTATPGWANRPRFGCHGGASDESRAVAIKSLPAYRRMIVSLLALARREGVNIRWWSAWNEPNAAFFLNPQRRVCSPTSPSLAPSLYAPLVRALRSALDAAPGHQEIVLGELSSPFAPRPRITETAEFVRGLPTDVACAGRVWSQHQYVGDADDLAELQRVVDERGCPGPPRRFWITETGVGVGGGRRRNVNPQVLKAGCQRLHGLLLRWHADPRTDAAIHYTFREDPAFHVGLADARLRRLYPVYHLMAAWGRRPAIGPPPALPAACA